jgi:membrane-associated protein
MEMIQEFFRTVYNVPELIRLVGLAGMIAIVFAETGLLIGFFLPGDSLLVTAGLFAARGDFNVVWLNIALSLAAIVGNAVGYTFGYRTGKALFNRPNSLFFRREQLLKTHAFYERHGWRTDGLTRTEVVGGAEAPHTRYAISL